MNAITKGSEAQIVWASKLVDSEVARIDLLLATVPAKEDRSEAFQRLYGEQIVFVKKVRNTLEKQIQSAKWVIDSRNNLFYYTAALLRKSSPEFAARFPLASKNDVTAQVNDGGWKF